MIGDDLGFTSDYLPFGDDLLDQITAAWDAREIVVIVINPWSLHWDTQTMAAQRQQLLQTLDRQNGFHWCVIVPWNEQDPDLGTEPQKSAVRRPSRRPSRSTAASTATRCSSATASRR